MASKVLFIFSLTLLAAIAETSSLGYNRDVENGAEQPSIWDKLSGLQWENKEDVRNFFSNLVSSFRPASSTQGVEDSVTRNRRSVGINNKLGDIVEPLSELLTIDVSQFKNRETRDVAIRQARDLTFDIFSNLNQLIKFILSYFLDELEMYIGNLIMQPVRSILDMALDSVLPCGITCTLLA